MTIQVKAIEQYFHVVLFYYAGQGSSNFQVHVCGCVAIQVKAIEQHFHVVLFIMLGKVVLGYMSRDETLVCDHFCIIHDK